MSLERYTKTVPVRRDQVFNAWTEPSLVREWMHPGGRQLSNILMDVQPGGVLRIDFADANGTLMHLGQFLEVKPPSKLSFTWHATYSNLPPIRVDLAFEEAGDNTRITLTHDPISVDGETVQSISWAEVLSAMANFVK